MLSNLNGVQLAAIAGRRLNLGSVNRKCFVTSVGQIQDKLSAKFIDSLFVVIIMSMT